MSVKRFRMATRPYMEIFNKINIPIWLNDIIWHIKINDWKWFDELIEVYDSYQLFVDPKWIEIEFDENDEVISIRKGKEGTNRTGM